jgi:hypothetical protein
MSIELEANHPCNECGDEPTKDQCVCRKCIDTYIADERAEAKREGEDIGYEKGYEKGLEDGRTEAKI